MSTQSYESQPSGQALPSGTRIEEFIIERVLGNGGFGITYLARDTGLGRHVVLKENLPVQFAWREISSGMVQPRHDVGGDAENYEWSMSNFLREAETLASLDHSGIVQVLNKFEANGTAYFVMPFVEGLPFDALIESRRLKDKPFSDDEIKGLLDRVLDALGYLHDRGIYHRDIKPANILISNDGIPILIDFGAARQRLSDRSMTVVESPGYTPFEQLQSRGNVGPWSDLYALGATLVKALTYEALPKAADRALNDPWPGLLKHPLASRRHSAALLGSIDRAVRPAPEKRWQNAKSWQQSMIQGSALSMGMTARPPASCAEGASSARPSKQQSGASVSQASRHDLNRHLPTDQMSSKRGKAPLIMAGAALAVLCIGLILWQMGGRPADQADASISTQAASPEASPSPPAATTDSSFEAAALKPLAWPALAEDGDPLAQALWGAALYHGHYAGSGIQRSPETGLRWISKSAQAGHPLGKFLLGLVLEEGTDDLSADHEETEKHFNEAVRLGLLRDALKGGPAWWMATGLALEKGKGVASNHEAAVTWYLKSAQAGDPAGMCKLAACHDTGTGVIEDDAVAAEWYRKAADAGSPQGMAKLGVFYQLGAGVPQSFGEAARWYRMAADHGDALAQVLYAQACAEGRGVPKNPTEAAAWYRKAAEQGNADACFLLASACLDGVGVPRGPTEAAHWYRIAARQGHVPAQVALADSLRHGTGVTQNHGEAVEWYRRAAEQGNAAAMNGLGDCHAEGLGVPRDPAEALKWYHKSAEEGNAVAQNHLGNWHMSGREVAQDPAEAVRWYRMAAEQGLAVAQTQLGHAYAQGKGVEANPAEAYNWYRKAADQGDPHGCLLLGICLLDGTGTATNPVEAARMLQQAAAAGLVEAQYRLSVCYHEGTGVGKDSAQSAGWSRMAAEKGHAGAQSNLGWCLANGAGVTKDEEEAVEWYRKSAEQGYTVAQYRLGGCYESGTGVAKDPAQAVMWYEKAAMQGHAAARNNLGFCHANGLGVPKDLVSAYMWTGLAAVTGNPQAKNNLKRIASLMTPGQIAEARQRIDEWIEPSSSDAP